MKLNLHRTDKVAEWMKVPVARRNRWQKLADTTGGVVTPANVITIIGLILALIGIAQLLAGNYWTAIILLIIGRLLDIVDGVVAERTGTKSPLGEAMDASSDKAIIILTVIALYVKLPGLTWLLTLLILPQIVIAIVTLVGHAKNREQHPSRLGKTMTLLAWIAIPLLLVLLATNASWPDPLALFVYLFTLVSAALGFAALYDYLPKSARL